MPEKKNDEKTRSSGYGNDSIEMYEEPDRVRKRPEIIFGSNGLEGCKQSFFEILANSIDEANAGYGREIRATVYRDHSMKIEDFGRGVPMGFNQRLQRWNWELVFCELYAGGKMDNKKSHSAYKTSLGTNGMGACATQCASVYMEVESYNGSEVSHMRFEKGLPVTGLEVRELSKSERRTGTVIRWLPDLGVFTDIAIPHEYFADVLHRQAAVNFGVKFILSVEQPNGKFESTEFYYSAEEGLSAYVRELVGDSSITEPVSWHSEDRGRDRADREEYYLEADFSFCFTQVSGKQEYYHNASWLEHGGSPDKAVRNAFVYAIDKFLRNSGKYNKNESKITYNDIADSLVIVISSHSSEASYEHQTKKAINNEFIAQSMTDFLKKQLDIYFIEHPAEGDRIAAQVLVNKRSRENAEKTRVDIRRKLSGTIDAANRVEKFVNCRSKDPAVRELYIVEGDSALTSCKLGRDADFQAIIPVRGKTLNCMKSDYKQIFDSEIIVDLLRVIGCGVELEKGAKVKNAELSTFDLSSLRWSKIIICTDADEDGFQIRTLLLTLFYRLLPTLLRERRVFIAESPLFEITSGGKTYFAYNEPEKAEILKKLGSAKYTLQRSKGLGENEPEMMWETTMNPATRRLIAVTPADDALTAEMFDVLLGNNLPARKKFIAENAARYMKDADI
ncbi:MAG: DNA topoisomerase [Clostridia bacterium]|nr:DNA topoisomerase [Clostridia bacterium]